MSTITIRSYLADDRRPLTVVLAGCRRLFAVLRISHQELVALLHGSGGGFVWLFAIFAALTLIIGVAVFWLPGRAPKAEAALREA